MKIVKPISSWLSVLLWCYLIFYLSSIPNLKTSFGLGDLILRKGAHITEYAVLFLLFLRALKNSGLSWQKKTLSIISIIFSILYAVSDEYHQAFVPTRGPSVVDVAVDALGVSIGYFLINYKEKHFNPRLKP